ncbi:hypothetical protein [Halorubellus sp. PRR65]|uniref:hypothetical protein n=1 Tax=Halorubellus sp. PRR65 TaxID=3098148 RepID=UPI002B2605AB|nr:hypothetical protein [Halorubellus sp. PRR65]
MLAAGTVASAFGLSGCLRLSQAEPTGTTTTGDDGGATTVDEATTERSTTEESTDTDTETTEYGSPKLGISKGTEPSTDPVETWSSDTGVNLHAGELRIIDTRDVA